MAAATYHEVLDRVKHLSPDQQLRLLEELAALLRRQMPTKPWRSILELQGLGKQLWQEIDAQAYVNQERDTWNG